MSEDKYSHYYKDVSKLNTIDVYGVCELFGVDDPSGATQHAIKKALCAGKRGAKDLLKDYREAVDTLERRIEMLETAHKKGVSYRVNLSPVHAAPVYVNTEKKSLEDAYDEPGSSVDIRDEHLNLQNDDYYEE